tara:strand:+ start:3997 stop:4458 length:462 start_codon:yes stop_codon:yes gene_type:complete
MTFKHPFKRKRNKGYSLADVLVASAILGVGVSAAASLTLTMNTQEDMSWRVTRGLNLAENAVALYVLGMAPSDAIAYLPTDPDTTVTVQVAEVSDTISEMAFKSTTFRASIQPVRDEGSWSEGKWTGGSQATIPTRTLDLKAYRSNLQIRNYE